MRTPSGPIDIQSLNAQCPSRRRPAPGPSAHAAAAHILPGTVRLRQRPGTGTPSDAAPDAGNRDRLESKLMRILIVSVIFGGLVLAGCSSDGPDRVVQARLKCGPDSRPESGEPCYKVSCDYSTFKIGEILRHTADTADACRAANGKVGEFYYTNRRLELGIKTAEGATYLVETDPNAKVAIGDKWPPR